MKSNQLIAKFIEVLSNLNDKGSSIPALIMSSPGSGKTSSLELYAKVKGYNLVTLIASQYSADDILGLQSVQNGKLVRLTPSWFNDLIEISKNGKKTILFIDEITTCDEFIQAPLLNLIFNKHLGSVSLPENCFIISAGNYSEELNGAFSMTAPLVNRFMILNISDSDYSFEEVLDNTFEGLDQSQYSEFLGLGYCTKTIYDFDKLKLWVKRNLKFTPSNITNNRDEGLLGFCTVRSLSYCLKFAREYMRIFNDDNWIRIIGDTLGKFQSGDDWLPIRNRLQEQKVRFMMDNVRTDVKKDFVTTFKAYLDEYKEFESGVRNYEPDYTEIESLLDIDKMTSNEVRIFTKAVESFDKDSRPRKLFEKFSKKLEEGINVSD